MVFFNRLVEHVSEASIGAAEPAILEYLSSSTPTVAILAGVETISHIATAVKGFLDAWETVKKFREARDNLTTLGISGSAISEVEEQIDTIVEEVVETTATTILLPYKGDEVRKNELGNALRQDARRLFGQIERGLVVQFRAEPPEDKAGKQHQALQNISDIGHALVFPAVAANPVLLLPAEIIEGELTSIHATKTTKTTTTKTTRRKKGA